MVEYPGWEALRDKSTSAYRITRLAHEEIIDRPLELSDGYLRLPDSPGLGLGNYVPAALSELEDLAAKGD